MTEDEARSVLLVRAADEEDASSLAPGAREAAWRAAGGSDGPEAFALRRATFLVDHLPDAARRLVRFELPPRELAIAALASAAALGLASNALSLGRRIHVLANPVTALVLWNVAVYAAMAAARTRRRSEPRGARDASAAPLRPVLALVARAGAAWARFRGRSAATEPDPTATARMRARFVADYASACAAPILARCEAVFHAGAIGFAAGALAGIFLQGVAFEYRVEWGSTLVSSADTRATIAALLFFPARLVLGAGFPGPAQLALASTPDGAPAAVWFHAFAITVACVVVAPRAALLAAARLRARRLARAIALPDDAPYWKRIAESPRAAPDTAESRPLLSSFALDTDACTLLASLEAALVAADIGATPAGRFDALGRKKRWLERWRALAARGFAAFPAHERPRIVDGAEGEIAELASRVRAAANPFAPALVLLELAAFEAYGPLGEDEASLRDRLGLSPSLGRDARARALANAARLLGQDEGEGAALRSALAASAREISGFYPKLLAGAAAGTAVGALTLGVAAPVAAGIAGKAVGVAGLAALKTGLAAAGGHAAIGAGLGAAGGSALVAGGGALLAQDVSPGGVPLTPASALAAAAKIEVFLRRVVAGQQRDATTFRATLRELRASVGRLRDDLPGYRLAPSHTTKQIQDRERVIAILDRVAQRNERWGHEWSGESGAVSFDPRS